MDYRVLIKPSAEKFIYRLSPNDAIRILRSIKNLETDPRPPGCLKLTVEEGYRIKIGKYRVLFEIDDKGKIVLIYRIKHRKDVYC